MPGQFDIRRPDGHLSGRAAGNLNRMAQGAAINGGNLLVRNFGGNVEVVDPRSQPKWMRTTGAAELGAHPWEEVMQTTAGEWVAHTDGVTGETDSVPLYMADGSNQLEGTIARAWLYPNGQWYIGLPCKNCTWVGAMRVDGGDETTGYDFTLMQQTGADPSAWEEIAGMDSATLGMKAFEANGTTVVAGSTIYHGQLDLCRETAFFFGGEFPKRSLAEFMSAADADRVGDLYPARLIHELVSPAGLVEYSIGDDILAHPVNLNQIPTTQTIYRMDRSEGEEVVNDLATYDADRCCDSLRKTTSSGGSGTGEPITESLCQIDPLPETLTALYRHNSTADWVEVTLTFNPPQTWNVTISYAPFGDSDLLLEVGCINEAPYTNYVFGRVTPTEGSGFESYYDQSYYSAPGSALAWTTPSDWLINHGTNQLVVTGHA